MALRDKEVDKFCKKLDILLGQHRELKLAIHNKRNEASLESELVTQFILSISVLWQAFINDLLISYILMDPSRTIDSIKNRIRQSIEDKFGAPAANQIHFNAPRNISHQQILNLLDPKGWNISVTTADQLTSKANDLLSSTYAIKFSLNVGDAEFYNYMVSLRNYLSHHSVGSRRRLKDSIEALTQDTNLVLKDNFNQIGPYLKALVDNDVTRAEFIAQRLINLATTL